MFHAKFSLFSKTKPLENKIDLFHDKLLDAAMNFKKAIRIYLKEKRSEEYKKINKQIKQIEHDADNLRRDIEAKLYTQNLIPDLRADVLNLVENLDKVINKFDEVVYEFYIEQPDIPEEYHMRFTEICDLSADCAENLSIASRAFSAISVPSATFHKKSTLSSMNLTSAPATSNRPSSIRNCPWPTNSSLTS